MKKRDMSAMKENDLKFDEIKSPFQWQILEKIDHAILWPVHLPFAMVYTMKERDWWPDSWASVDQ